MQAQGAIKSDCILTAVLNIWVVHVCIGHAEDTSSGVRVPAPREGLQGVQRFVAQDPSTRPSQKDHRS